MNPIETKGAEARASPRFDVLQSAYLESAEATARNISAEGIYFVSPVPHEIGSHLNVTVEYMRNGELHLLQFEGEVVRLEERDDGATGVAARLLTPFFAEDPTD